MNSSSSYASTRGQAQPRHLELLLLLCLLLALLTTSDSELQTPVYGHDMGIELDIGWEFESRTAEGWGNATTEVE